MMREIRVPQILLLCVFLLSATIFGQTSLDSLTEYKNYSALRVSSYDRAGGNGDFLAEVTGEKILAEVEGPGEITHIWVTINSDEQYHLRKIILRAYWDGEENPSIETPIGDFFGLGHGTYYQYTSYPISIGTFKGMNSFWKMPFSKSAKITITNEGNKPIKNFYYYVDYRKINKDAAAEISKIENAPRFHAIYNQITPAEMGGKYLLLHAKGRGHFAGCNLSIQLGSNGWWGEGDDIFYIDGDASPTLIGTGSEDYFCGAWCYGEAFSNMYFGCPLRGDHAKDELWNVYRYHIEDPIPFTTELKMYIETVHSYNFKDPGDDYSSVSYWYQSEPHYVFAELPPVEKRLPRAKTAPVKMEGMIEGEDLKVIDKTKEIISEIQDMTAFPDTWSNNKQLWFRANKSGDFFEVEIEVPQKSLYFIEGYFTKASDYGQFNVYADGKKLNQYPIDGFNGSVVNSKKIKLGERKLSKGKQKIKFVVTGKNSQSTGFLVGLDCLRLVKLEKIDAGTEIIIDNKQTIAEFRTEGKWTIGSGGGDVGDYNGDVCWAMKGNGDSKAYWNPILPDSGKYSVYLWYGNDPINDHATDAPFTIYHKDGMELIHVDLKQQTSQWNFIGTYKFERGDAGYVMTTNKANGNVLADAVKFVFEK